MTNLKIKLHHGLVNRTPKQRATAQSSWSAQDRPERDS